MGELRRQFVRRSGLVQRFGVLADGLFDEGFPILGTVELNVSIVKRVFGGQPHPDEVADSRRSVISVFKRCIDPLEEFAMALLGVHETDAELCHSIEYEAHCHKVTGNSADLVHLVQSAPRAERPQSYNTVETIVVTKRSKSSLENAPGCVPGCRLELARFVIESMQIDEPDHHKDSGSTGYEPTADVEVAV